MNFQYRDDGARGSADYECAAAIPGLREDFQRWIEWLKKAEEHAGANPSMRSSIEPSGLVKVETVIGPLLAAFSIVEDGAEPVGRIVFYEPATPLMTEARAVFAVRIYTDGTLRYGDAKDGPEWGTGQRSWLPSEFQKLAYQLMRAQLAAAAIQ